MLLSRDGAGRRRLDVGVEVDGEAVQLILARISFDRWKWNVCVIMLHCSVGSCDDCGQQQGQGVSTRAPGTKRARVTRGRKDGTASARRVVPTSGSILPLLKGGLHT